MEVLFNYISQKTNNKTLQQISDKIENNIRISNQDALFLYQQNDISLLAFLANFIKEKRHGCKVFYNKNIHIEPTNICICKCKFCSYYRQNGDPDAWEYSIEQIIDTLHKLEGSGITEVHIVGGINPQKDLYWNLNLVESISNNFPNIHIKAYTAIELDYMFRMAGISTDVGIQRFKKAGLKSIPGGGAEIFDKEVRNQLCPGKASAETWLNIHQNAHNQGIVTNATMLYGHFENYSHRVDHLSQLRDLQDKTNGFNCFVPLKFRRFNNQFSNIQEVTYIEDLKNYAISRIYLDNFPHLKAYWPMIGLDTARMSLNFGVDDFDGTIIDSTKIYTMAGVKSKQSMMTSELTKIIKDAGFEPVERDSLYNEIRYNNL